MPDAPDLRVSDAEREQTADRLRAAAGEGRLDPEELDERLTRAFGALTRSELTALTADLPAPAEPGSVDPAQAGMTDNPNPGSDLTRAIIRVNHSPSRHRLGAGARDWGP